MNLTRQTSTFTFLRGQQNRLPYDKVIHNARRKHKKKQFPIAQWTRVPFTERKQKQNARNVEESKRATHLLIKLLRSRFARVIRDMVVTNTGPSLRTLVALADACHLRPAARRDVQRVSSANKDWRSARATPLGARIKAMQNILVPFPPVESGRIRDPCPFRQVWEKASKKLIVPTHSQDDLLVISVLVIGLGHGK